MSWFDDLLGGASKIAAIAQPVTDLIGGWMKGTAQDRANKQNMQIQQLQWQREDTAAQRRAADFAAAGINPLLASGSTASSSVTTTQQPVTGEADAVSGLIRGMMNTQQILAETQLVQQQKEKVKADTEGQNIANDFAGTMNPLKKEAMQLDIDLQKASNPQKVEMLKSTLKGMDLQQANTAMDTALKNAGINQAEAQTAFTKAQTKLAGQNLSNLQQDFYAKVIAVETAGISRDIMKELAKTNPGLADGIAKWMGIVNGVITGSKAFY